MLRYVAGLVGQGTHWVPEWQDNGLLGGGGEFGGEIRWQVLWVDNDLEAVLLEVLLRHDVVAVLTRVLTPGVLDTVAHRDLGTDGSVDVAGADQHGVGHQTLVVLDTVLLVLGEIVADGLVVP